MRIRILFLTVMFCFITAVSCSANAGLVNYNGGFFQIKKPAGWNVVTAGKGCTLAFLVRDPSSSLRQIFSFTEVGPFYASEQHKMTEINYVNSGGYKIQWTDMPVVTPLTVSSFYKNFHAISQTRIGKGFMPGMPALENFTIVSAKNRKSPVPGFSIEIIRAVFKQNGKVGEGLFTGMVGMSQPYGWGFFITGITAPKGELKNLEPELIESLASFSLSSEYVEQCKKEQQDNFEGLLRAGKTMRETSDIIMDGWSSRSRSEDIVAEKRSDQIRGKDRYYDPESGAVYEFDLGEYEQHSSNSRLSKLQPLPADDYNLWTKPAKDGSQLIRG